MPHGTPDYGITAGAVTTYQLSDLAELAVRLGSIVSYDRLGEVFFLDDFEQTRPRYATGSDGVGGGVAYSVAEARSGLRSLALTAGSDAGLSAYAFVEECGVVPSGIGLACSFAVTQDTATFTLQIQYDKDGDQMVAALQYNLDTLELLIFNAAGAFEVVATDVHAPKSATRWNAIKVVADFATHQYIRARFGANSYDLSAHEIFRTPSGGGGQFEFSITVGGIAALNSRVCIDDLILTQNEPA